LLLHGVLLLLVCWVREVELLVLLMVLLLLHACRVRSGGGSRSVSRAAVRRLANARNRMVLRVHHTRTEEKHTHREKQTEVTCAEREQRRQVHQRSELTDTSGRGRGVARRMP
jgi:hypothetical protein